MLTAQEAKQRLASRLNVALEAELKTLDDEINRAIAKNKNIVYVRTLSDQAKAKLKENGYIVESYNNTDPRDHVSDRGFKISF